MPKCEEISAGNWWWKLDTFPLKISEVSFTGGEPLQYNNLEYLLYLLNSKYYITIYTNLMIKEKKLAERFSKMKKFKLDATYHSQYSRKVFEENLVYYRQFCTVNEIVFNKKPSLFPIGSNKQFGKTLVEKDDELKCLDDKRFMYTPDGTLCTSLREYITRNV